MTGERVLLVINRSSGGGAQAIEPAMRVMHRHGHRVSLHAPADPSEINDLIIAHGTDCERIVVAGGDGTFSRSATALLQMKKPVGLIPLGTANDLARTLGIPVHVQAAAHIAAGNNSRNIDLGMINDRPFFNVASIGFSARVAAYHDGERKRRLKLLSYPLSWLDAQRDMKPFRVSLSYGKRRRKFQSTMVAVGNGVHFGGGLMIADDAAIDDGWLDVFYVRPLGPVGMLRLLVLLRLGAIRRRQDIRSIRTRELLLESEPDQDFNVDGEIVERTPARFRVLREALRVFAPDPEATVETGGNMDLFRDNQVVAIDDVVVALRSEVSRLETAVEEARSSGLVNEGLTAKLVEAAEGYKQQADQLAEIIRQEDDIPSAPSDEAQLLEHAAMLLKRTFTDDASMLLGEELSNSADRIREVARDSLSEIDHAEAREIIESLID